jgi:hypothetical protein
MVGHDLIVKAIMELATMPSQKPMCYHPGIPALQMKKFEGGRKVQGRKEENRKGTKSSWCRVCKGKPKKRIGSKTKNHFYAKNRTPRTI